MDVCREYEKLMGACVDDTATLEERARLDRHAEGCTRCARAWGELKRTRELLISLPPVKHSPRLMPAVSARLRAQRVSPGERLWWRASSHPMFQPAVAAVLLLCIAVTGTAIYHGSALQPGTHLGSQVAQMYPQPAAGGSLPATDDYVSYCVASHETFDRERAFGDPGAVQQCAYAP
jgi:anti-sigma factor RsiW